MPTLRATPAEIAELTARYPGGKGVELPDAPARKPAKRKPAAIPWVAARSICNARSWLFWVPCQVVNHSNRREHWTVANRRKQDQWAAMAAVMMRPRHFGLLPCVVTLTRLYLERGRQNRAMDSDNLQRAFKGCRDAVATWLTVDDADPHVEWRYSQTKTGVVGITIAIELVRP